MTMWSEPTLHQQFSCAMLSQIYLDIQTTLTTLWTVGQDCADVGRSRPVQQCVGYFPVKKCLYAQGQYCRSNNFLVQCCLKVFGQYLVYNIPMQVVPA